VEDALSAYRWLLGQRPGEVVVAGDSAGAGLACSLMMSARTQDLPLPAAALFLCPGVDPTGNAILSAAGGGEPPEDLEKLTRTMQAYLDGHPAEDPVVNPLMADLSGLPPMLVQAATGDMILPDAQRLVDRALAHGVDARLELYPADTHVFHVFWSFLPEAADALQRAGAFARSSLAGHSPALEQPG
jgi:monoterpene epsilon-lactone hydrolase